MNNITIRFLNSIKINNINDYDLNIIKTTKDKNNVYNFTIFKDSKWDYSLLNFFNESLNNIKSYKYTLNFEYNTDINIQDISELLSSYFSDNFSYNFNVKINNEYLNLEINKDYKNEAENIIDDFFTLLKFINYPLISIKINEFDLNNSIKEELIDETNDLDYLEEEIDSQDYQDEDFDFLDKEAYDYENESELISSKDEYNSSIEKKLNEDFINNKSKGDYIYKKLKDIIIEKEKVSSEGYIYSISEPKEIGKDKKKITLLINDGETSKFLEIISNNKNLTIEYISTLSLKQHIKFCGKTYKNNFLSNSVVIIVDSFEIDGEYPIREDDYNGEKRVELHLHTKMSTMDGVSTITDYCKTAKNMGHTAIALTDHGVLQAYPEAAKAAKKYGIKILYGCELYMIEDEFVNVYNPVSKNLNDVTYVVFDLETTGLCVRKDSIIEFGAVKVKNGIVLERLDYLINPGFEITPLISQLTNITNEMLFNKPKIQDILDEILNFIKDCVLVSHNLEFDYGFLYEALLNYKNYKLENTGIDTLSLARYLHYDANTHNLGALCRRYKIDYDTSSAHRADYDAEVLSKAWSEMLVELNNNGYFSINQIEKFKVRDKDYKHCKEYHVTAICKNQKGLKDLFKIVSLSHIKYFGRVPCVLRSLLTQYRDNLLLGSACFNGEVFQKSRISEKRMQKAIRFYDFIEIQPDTNYSYLINIGEIKDLDTLHFFIDDIILKANEENKLICATGDVHYLNKEDKKFRDVYIYSSGVGKTSHPLYSFRRVKQESQGIYFENPDQYYKNTNEMLEDFKRFGQDNAIKWVITNPNIIANMCDEINPIKDKLYTPKIENSDKELKEICYKNAHDLYGEKLPKIIEERLEKELNGIINNGYGVIYYLAYKIIKKTHEDDYIVGSRGSVGSSLVATLANITEVNPLPPYYRCPKCKHFELYDGKQYFSGCDLPAKKCPKCGTNLIGEGQNIPFETFLGFNADKVPDIDLNFPPDYQSKAHDYTKVLFGDDNCFRAGTISTVAEKTAFGYAKGYFEKRYKYNDDEILKKVGREELSFLSANCVDVKRTTGQHPGGIVVVPKNMDVFDFTPIQYPADNTDMSWKTTHFDFKAIHDNILKLDLLGHVDPQALKELRDLTNIKLEEIPLNDKKVLSLFSSAKELHLIKNYLNLKNGALGLPEFGTEFVRGLLDEAKPKTFSDLIIVSGLSHGTNVWRGNAQKLIKNKITDLRGVVGCRDDIMTVLINKYNVDYLQAFNIMEDVRHGKGLKEEYVKVLKQHNVPDFYIESCNKIKYLFPKAHATAYVTMAVRVAYFKLYYPLEFYSSFYSVRSEKYDWETMYKGPQAILEKLKEIDEEKRTNVNKNQKKYDEIKRTLEVCLEMYDRGIKFSNIDIYKSDSKVFKIDKENKLIIPAFKVIDSLGESVGDSIVEARKEKQFISIEDFEKRCKINSTQINLFKRLGIFKDLPEKEREQVSLFDFL